jgi:hypothetical protein
MLVGGYNVFSLNLEKVLEDMKRMGLIEKELEFVTRERDLYLRYKTLYEEAKARLDEILEKLGAAKAQGGSAMMALNSSSLPQIQGLNQNLNPSQSRRLELLEGYVLKLDWMKVPYPPELEDLFQKSISTYVRTDGKTYTGEMVRGKANGRGKLTGKDGKIWEGWFLQEEFHGPILCTPPDRTFVQESYYQRGEGQGLFSQTYADGRIRLGCFKDGKIQGVVKEIHPDGKIDYGNVADNNLQGQYVSIASDGEEIKIWNNSKGVTEPEIRIYRFSHLTR